MSARSAESAAPADQDHSSQSPADYLLPFPQSAAGAARTGHLGVELRVHRSAAVPFLK